MKHYDSLIIGRITKDFNIDHLKNEIRYSFTKSSSVLAQRLPILVNILPPSTMYKLQPTANSQKV
nr:hypothetical protein [Eubacteriales bacterium]